VVQTQGKTRWPPLLPTRLRFMLDDQLSVAEILDKAADARPDIMAFHLDERLDNYGIAGSEIDVSSLRDLINRLSNLLGSLGIAKYDRVAIWKRNSLDYFLLSYAAMRLGAVAVPINGGMAVSGLTQFLALTGAKLLCTDHVSFASLGILKRDVLPPCVRCVLLTDDGIDAASDLPATGLSVSILPRQLGTMPTAFTAPAMAADQDVLICHTSGTTGFPKGVLHGSRSLALAARGQIRIQPVSRRNIALSAGWMNHHIMISGCLAALVAGLALIPAVDLRPAALLRRIATDRVNIFFAFPDVYLGMIREGLDRYDLDSIRLWMSGGDAMHEAHIRQFVANGAFLRIGGRRIVGSFFCELLGTSEVGIVALMKLSHRHTSRYGRCVGQRTAVSPDVKVADQDGNTVAQGVVGRLMVKGPTLFKGYWNDHAKSHGVVIDGWWWTGDLAFRDRRGRFYQVDREVDCVETSAGPVYGLLVEEEALKHPDVHEAVLFGAAGRDGFDVPMLLVQPIGGRAPEPGDIKRFVESRIKIPVPIEQVIVVANDEDIPRGVTGKVLKRMLRDQYGATTAVDHPRTIGAV
jgi:long-chain acyl-CoA synthetase